MSFDGRNGVILLSPASVSSFFSALQRVATSVRRLHLGFVQMQSPAALSTREIIAALLPALEAVAPYLECCWMCGTES